MWFLFGLLHVRRVQAGIDSSRYDTVGSVWSCGEILGAAVQSSDPDPPGKPFHLSSLARSFLEQRLL